MTSDRKIWSENVHFYRLGGITVGNSFHSQNRHLLSQVVGDAPDILLGTKHWAVNDAENCHRDPKPGSSGSTCLGVIFPSTGCLQCYSLFEHHLGSSSPIRRLPIETNSGKILSLNSKTENEQRKRQIPFILCSFSDTQDQGDWFSSLPQFFA